MSEVLKPGELVEGLSQLERLPAIITSLGSAACIQLDREVTLSHILNGSIPISESSIIFDQSGIQIDTSELLTHVAIDLTARREY